VADLADEPQYLLLMRHAAHRGGHLTDAGSAHVHALAERLSEWMIAEWRDQPDRTVRLWCTTTATEVQETIDLLTRDVLTQMQRRGAGEGCPFAGTAATTTTQPAGDGRESRQPWMGRALPELATGGTDPARVLSAYSPDEDAFKALCRWLNAAGTGDESARRSTTDVPLLVGNDPLVGWLASRLLGGATPVARGELVCLVLEPRRRACVRRTAEQAGRVGGWRLLWTISEDGETEAEAVRAKIKSKMNTAAALGTVIVGLTTFLLQNSLRQQQSVYQWLAFAALGASALLYFATLFLYDTLQMPQRFWAGRFPSGSRTRKASASAWSRLRHGKVSIRRPPSSTARVLQTSMVQIWVWIFTPATVLAGAGVALFALGATPRSGQVIDVQPWHVLVAIAGITILVAAWLAWHRPDLGAAD
jgi:hypothetical protein